MCVAYNGNAKAMDILHGAITNRFDGNIAAYWKRYKDALLADAELETLISVEMDWLRDNQPDAYKLLCRMGCYRYQDIKTVPFEGLICLLWDVPKSRRNWAVDYLGKSSLVELKNEYFLHPAVREASKSRLLEIPTDWDIANRSAIKFWTDSVEKVENINDGLKAFEAYYHAIQISDFNSASQVILKLRSNNLSQNSPLGKSFYRLGLLELGIRSIKSILDKKIEDDMMCVLLNILGDLYWLIGNIQEALECHNNSKEIAIKRGMFLQQKLAYFNMALCYFDLWEIDLCISLCQSAIVIESGDAIGTHTCSSLFLSWIYSFEDVEKANLFIQDTLKILPDVLFLEWGSCYSLFFVGGYLLNKGELQSALETYNQMLSIAESSNYKQAKAKALIGIGIIERKKNQTSKALMNILKASELLLELNAKPDLAESYFQLGLTYQAMKEYDQVETYKAKALKLFGQMEAPKQIERVNQAFEQGAK